MSPTQIIVIVVAAVLVVAVATAIWAVGRRAALRRRFGPEYDQVVADRESRGDAERELRDRTRRHAELTLTPLSPESRQRYASTWAEIQARFVDAPNDSVGEADELVTRLIAERGYPTGNYDEQLASLSVEHARTLSHYRDAHEIRERDQRGEAGTEDLRQALVHYRALFADLLGADPVRPDGPATKTTPTGSDNPEQSAQQTSERAPRHTPQDTPSR
ncbi:hypothetical protein BDK92_2320 [Micromonospora pisi]|uniref:Secreted protein n=1 Tax=Micromonospora pisi TaxID=589240 RepID=A0A495JG86_9ACTN|nr:hypothetical protein [Micromonospora pisi]RKR88016.1 hypothetical protein BDK92_2320 [Micromonospora pisi]